MMPQTIGAICLGPSGNEQGGHYFMSLMTGHQLHCDQWTELPMPHDAVTHVGHLGHAQDMPKSLTFADHYGFELLDEAEDVDDDHDSDFDPADDADFDPVDDAVSYSSSDDDSSDDDSDHGTDFAQPLLGLSAGVDNYNYDHNHDNQDGNDSQHSHDESNHSDDVSDSDVDEDDDDEEDNEEDDNNDDGGNDDDDDNNNGDEQHPEINVPMP